MAITSKRFKLRKIIAFTTLPLDLREGKSLATLCSQLLWENNMKKYWIPLFAVLSLCGCATNDSKLPVEVSINELDNVGAYSGVRSTVVVRTVSDSVQINKVTVNRGNNCKIVFWHQQWSGSGSLKFGQSVTGEDSCDMDAVKEVEVETDKDSYTFTF